MLIFNPFNDFGISLKAVFFPKLTDQLCASYYLHYSRLPAVSPATPPFGTSRLPGQDRKTALPGQTQPRAATFRRSSTTQPPTTRFGSCAVLISPRLPTTGTALFTCEAAWQSMEVSPERKHCFHSALWPADLAARFRVK